MTPHSPVEDNPYAPPLASTGRPGLVKLAQTSAVDLILVLLAAGGVGLITFLVASAVVGFVGLTLLGSLAGGPRVEHGMLFQVALVLVVALALLTGGLSSIQVVRRLYRWILAPPAGAEAGPLASR